MDWRTAKNYIIVLLLVLNIFLICSIVAHNNNTSIDNPYFSKKAMKELQTILESKNIRMGIEISKEIHKGGIVNVFYQNIDEKSNPNIFLDFENVTKAENGKRVQIEIPYSKVEEKLGEDFAFSNDESRKQFAMAFLKKYFAGNGYHFKIKNVEKFIFNPIIEGIIFEDSDVCFEFTEGEIIVNAISIGKEESPTDRREMITSVEAILSALPQLSDESIIDMDFIYYFDLEDEELYKVKNARAFPHWRIITDKDKVIYVSAIAG